MAEVEDGLVAERTTGPMARWVSVLGAFVDRGQWGVRELAAALRIPPSSVHRILREMERLGLVAEGAERGQFRMGAETVRLAVLLAERVDVTRIARPILEDAATEIGETVILTAYSPLRRQFWAVDAVETHQPIRYIWESLRTWSDLYHGASGKGILAFLDELQRAAIIGPLPDTIPGPRPISKADLLAELERARQRGYVISHGERFAGAVGVSAPLRDAVGHVVGDLIASWPDNRTSPDKEATAARVIVRAARDVSRQLGYVAHDDPA